MKAKNHVPFSINLSIHSIYYISYLFPFHSTVAKINLIFFLSRISINREMITFIIIITHSSYFFRTNDALLFPSIKKTSKCTYLSAFFLHFI